MSIRHGVYIQEEATAVQVPKTGNSSVQVVVGTAPVNMAENPSEAVNVQFLRIQELKPWQHSDIP